MIRPFRHRNSEHSNHPLATVSLRSRALARSSVPRGIVSFGGRGPSVPEGRVMDTAFLAKVLFFPRAAQTQRLLFGQFLRVKQTSCAHREFFGL
jgi:hypothetical protein